MNKNSLRSEKSSCRKRLLSCFALIGGLILGTQMVEPTTADAGYRYSGYRSAGRYNNCYRGYRQPARYSYRGGSGYGYRNFGNRYGYRSYSNSYHRPNNRYYNYRY